MNEPKHGSTAQLTVTVHISASVTQGNAIASPTPTLQNRTPPLRNFERAFSHQIKPKSCYIILRHELLHIKPKNTSGINSRSPNTNKAAAQATGHSSNTITASPAPPPNHCIPYTNHALVTTPTPPERIVPTPFPQRRQTIFSQVGISTAPSGGFGFNAARR